MTSSLLVYDAARIAALTRRRDGEVKVGERVLLANNVERWADDLKNSPAKFVLVGLPEDIGVRANFGRGGAWSAWEPALFALLNMQSNKHFSGEELLVLGHVDFSDLMEAAKDLDFKSPEGLATARSMVETIDSRVEPVLHLIATAGKIPIIIGGGHNNAFPVIKGVAEGLQASGAITEACINAVNCDAHADFRTAEGRHSGNGFRYAYAAGRLGKYAIVGLQESYTGQNVLDELSSNEEHFLLHSFDDVFIHHTTVGSFGYAQQYDLFGQAVDEACRFTKHLPTGIELDLDIIENTPSSAKTSSGISANDARRYVYHCARHTNPAYLHLAEAAPVLAHIKADNKTGKLLAFLATDFMKGFLLRK